MRSILPVPKMEQQQAKIQMLENMLYTMREQMYQLEKVVKQEREELCKICEKQEGGHQFVRESDGDYHRPRWYQVCTRCHYSTQFA